MPIAIQTVSHSLESPCKMKKVTVNNPRYPHYIRIVRKEVSYWLDDEKGEKEFVVYAGPGRSYTDTTTTGDGKVDTNKRKASIPIRFDGWNEIIPMSGDILHVTKGNISEEWEVKDFEPDNDRTVVYGVHNRNLNNG